MYIYSEFLLFGKLFYMFNKFTNKYYLMLLLYVLLIINYFITTSLSFSTVQYIEDMMLKSTFKKISQIKFGVSEPPPSWFGNKENEKNDNWTNENWLKSRFHFSFAEYSNPRNQNYGVLRVLNDDLVQPERGFGSHPHRNVEICTYIVEGSLTHKDSTGTEETLQRGAIQYMTAGKGVTHSEHNHDKTKPLRFIQMWLNTRTQNLAPKYGGYSSNLEERKNKWGHLVTDVLNTCNVPIKINQDANIFASEIDSDITLNFEIKNGRQAYILCMEGSVEIKGTHGISNLDRHDSAEASGGNILEFKTTSSTASHILIVEMSFSGDGRTDI